jgi:hypothetical protein
VTQAATQQQASQDDETDIEALFDEAASGGSSATDEQADDTAKDEDKQAEGEGEAKSDPDLDLPDNTVVGEATDKEASTDDDGDKPEEKPAPSWRDALSEEAKAEIDRIEAEARTRAEEVKKLKHAARSDAGRVAALTRKVEELSRAPKNESDAKRQAREALLKQLEDDYPQIATVIRAVRDESVEAAQNAEALAKKTAEESAAKARADAAALVEAAHPGWEQLRQTPEFKEWRKQQKPEIEALAWSDKPEDAILMFDAFREAHPATSSKTQDATVESKPDATQGKPASQKTAAEIKAERDKKLAAARGVETKVAARESTTDAGGDVEALFDAETRRRERQNTRK